MTALAQTIRVQEEWKLARQFPHLGMICGNLLPMSQNMATITHTQTETRTHTERERERGIDQYSITNSL